MKIIRKKVCMLGDFAVGKTSLVRRSVEGRFDDRYLSTIGVKLPRKTLQRQNHRLDLLLWDLAGGEKFTHYQENYLRGSVGALIVCDLTRHETITCLDLYSKQLRTINQDAKIVFVGNKLDLEDQRQISSADLEAISKPYNSPYLLTSAKTGEQIEDAIQLLADLIETQNESPTPQ